jgi:hypothetical protein
MFVRFRQSGRRLQLSLVETQRFGGKVRHEHVASLGSIIVPPSVVDRIAFWARRYQVSATATGRPGAQWLGPDWSAVPMA